jgi:pyridoxamine 5'-phosphate oxidase
MKNPDIADLRRNYTRAELIESSIKPEPFAQFQDWFADARANDSIIEPNAMTLATTSADGQPTARTMLLKGVDEYGFVFFTNYESRKGNELRTNPRACLLFTWPPLERQVRIEGVAERILPQETEEYFATRPLESRLGAWASAQSTVIPHREYLAERFEAVAKQYSDGNVPVPPFWGGIRVVPLAVEFWQGRPGRLHDRLRYRREHQTATEWHIERLSP